ncbi:MAG: ABC transporter ATP-binding protein [Candidatus Staskawiczbacteria bacterium]|nr:ABC transporter ATP-binding protein [Candidatus Staskawiczbacteria bacterium]
MSFLILLSFLSGALEGIGTSAIIPLFAMMGGNGNGGDNMITKIARQFFDFIHLPLTLKYLLIFMILIFLIKAGFSFLVSYINIFITANYENKIRRELFFSTLIAGWPFLSKQKLGYLEQTLTIDASNSSNLLLHLGGIIPVIVSILVYSFLAVNVSWVLAILTLLVGGFIFYFFKPVFFSNRKYAGELAQINKEASHFVNENMLGLKTIKAMHVEGSISKRAYTYFDKIKILSTKLIIVRSVLNVSMQPIGLIYIFAIFIFFYKFSTFNLGYFAILVYAINRIFNQIQTLQGLLHYIVTEEPYFKSVSQYYRTTEKNIEVDGVKNKFNFGNEIVFKDIDFSYDREQILNNINFKIKKGEMIGLIGHSGSGKTTIVDLLLRLYRPQKGEITIDNVDISDINLEEWRTHVGYVSQDMFLINDTIENNIKFYNENLTSENIANAASQANILDFIESLPQKFQTVVGERGTMISGGQRQRIVLARVLARKPELLILDEATSSLDNESEIQIQKVIEGLRGKITVLVIAHRLSTIMNTDKLLVLDGGKISEGGKPQELLQNKNSYFFKVYNIRNNEA